MKNSILFVIYMMTLCCSAQVRIASTAEKTSDINARYDSTQNYLYPGVQSIYAYKGQDLFVLPTSSEYYNDFSPRPSIPFRVKASELSQKIMHVDSVFEIDGILGKEYTLELTCVEDGKKWYYNYPNYETSFRFLCLGYKKHYEDTHRQLDYLVRHGIRYWNMVDFETGQRIEWEPTTVWKFNEFIYDPKHGLAGLYKNNDGQTIAIYHEYDIIPTSLFDGLVSEYGRDLCVHAMKGLISKAMPGLLLEIAWGQPNKKDYDTYGEYWIYDNSLVRVENDKVVSWSSY